MSRNGTGTNGTAHGMSPIRVVIVEDERLGRQRIVNLLEGRENAEVVAACGDAPRALEAIERDRPDLVFLDIEMPELSGFDLIERFESARPRLIVVTAHEHYALRAFDEEAVDFLLKPFSRQRFDAAFERAARRIRRDRGDRLIRQLAELSDVRDGTGATADDPTVDDVEDDADAADGPEGPHGPLRKLVVKDGARKILVDVAEIEWIEAADYYARIHAGADTHLIRRSLGWLDEHLDPRRFVRIHRSSIVNVDRVREIRPWSGGTHNVLMEDGTELRLSASRRCELERLLGQSL